jgi:hypothetical protein
MCRSNVSQTLVSLDEDDPVRSGEGDHLIRAIFGAALLTSNVVE